MPIDKSIQSRAFGYGIAGWLVVVMALYLFRADDPWRLGWLLSISAWLLLRPLPFRSWSQIDRCVVALTAFDVLSCFSAAAPIPAWQTACFSAYMLTLYFLCRRLFQSEHALKIFCLGSLLPIGAALALAICSFFVFRHSVLGVGFADTYHFRFLFRPLGYITNVWAEVLLLLLGWVCLVRRYSGLFTFLTVWAILLSFSRGAYIALGAYVVLWVGFVKPNREKLHMLSLTLIALLFVWIFFPVELKTTLKMNQTVSQRQSTNGRIDATQAAWEAFCEHPLLGYGNGNYTLAIDRALNQDSTRSYTTIPPNLLVQLLAEKGLLGVLLYLLLLVAIGRLLWKQRAKPESRMAVCLLSALAVKEMTQASLLHTPFTLFLFYLLLSFWQKGETEADGRKEAVRVLDYGLPGIALLLYFVYLGLVLNKNQNDKLQQEIESVWKQGKYAEAIRLMEQTGEQTPDLINRGLLYFYTYRKTGEPSYWEKAETVWNKVRKQQPEDVQIEYLMACLYLEKGEPERALDIAARLVAEHPRNALYLFIGSEASYRLGDKEAALSRLVESIRYMPRLLTEEHVQKLRQSDPDFYRVLELRLALLKPGTGDAPADYARYGYIAHKLGDHSKAESYLRKAVSELPNLATPWYLLGDTDKYRLLIYGAFQKDLRDAEIPDQDKTTEKQLFEQYYRFKFFQWYGTELLSLKQ